MALVSLENEELSVKQQCELIDVHFCIYLDF